MKDVVPAAAASLITIAEHSVLGTRWIYDGEADSTEAFAWTFAIITVAMAVGSAFGGVIIQDADTETAFLSAGDLAGRPRAGESVHRCARV